MFRWFLALAAIIIAADALGAVNGSHHDMQVSETGEGWACYYCHATYNSVIESAYYEEEPDNGNGLGPVGVICYACHDGTAYPDARIEELDGNIGLPALLHGHGSSLSNMETATNGLEGQSNLAVSGLLPARVKYTGKMDCTACHDPHNSDYPPFLRMPLETLCQSCHSGSDGKGMGRWTTVEDSGQQNGYHPVGMPVVESKLDFTREMASEKAFHGPESFFNVPAPDKTALMNPDTHWEMGGHLFGPKKTVSCPTCHSAHLSTENLLVAEVSSNPVRMLCMGCHGKEVFSNTPGKTPNYHPVFEESAEPYEHDHSTHGDVGDPTIPSEGFFDLSVKIPSPWPVGTEGELACQTCHVSHNGRAGAKCLRGSPDKNVSICNDCHGYQEQRSSSMGHHPTSATPVKTTDSDTPSWNEGKGTPGYLGDGLQCIDCHVGLSRSAHNW